MKATTVWQKRKLSDLADMCLGKMLDQNKNKGEFLPYLANINVRWGSIDLHNLREMRFEEKESERYGLKYGDIVMCEGGEPGRCAIWKNQTPSMMIQKALHRIRVKSGFDSFFLYYSLLNKGLNGQYDGYFTGAAIKHLTGENLAKVEVDFPPLSIQKKIGAVLAAYDDLIENNLKRIRLLEEMAQITYEEWFVRLRFPGHESTPINPETGLPEGWSKKQIQDIGDVITGKTPSTTNSDFFGQDVPFIKTPDMADAPYVIRTEQSLSKLGADSQKKKYLPKNSLMVSCIGTVGVTGLVAIPSQTNQQINSIVFRNPIYTYFMYCLSRRLKPLLDGLGSNGATMTNVNKGKFEAIEFDCPSDELLEKFHSSVSSNFDAVLNLQFQNQRLREARDILLPRLMTGVIDAESYDPAQLLKEAI
ncbi:MAG: restriction endonuclease subunit S [Alphaproteobacteria bacterium]|nr:restriction endonuclease subunit S [Alphaproteobacteria bacterium]